MREVYMAAAGVHDAAPVCAAGANDERLAKVKDHTARRLSGKVVVQIKQRFSSGQRENFFSKTQQDTYY